MIPSAVPRNVASVLPSRAAASTQTNRPRSLRQTEHLSVRAARARCWPRHRYSHRPGRACQMHNAQSVRRERHSGHRSPARSRPPRQFRRATCRLYSSAFLRALSSKVRPSSTTAGREEKPGMPAISTPCRRAAPAKSRSLPAFEVAMRIRRPPDAFPSDADPSSETGFVTAVFTLTQA